MTQQSSTIAPVIARQPGAAWLFNGPIDLLCLGGLGLVLYALITGLNYSSTNSPSVQLLILAAAYLISFPHYAATYHRVYSRWSEITRYWSEALVAPAVLAVLGACCFVVPAFAPLYFKAFILFNGYHFSGQTYGVSMVFLGKSGIRLTQRQKCCLIVPIYLAFLAPVLSTEVAGSPPAVFFGTALPVIGLPAWPAQLALVGFWIGVALYGWLTYWCVRTLAKPIPAIVHIVMASQLVWFLLGPGNQLFAICVPFFHALQYLVITSYFYFKGAVAKDSAAGRSPLAFLLSHRFLNYYLSLVLIGIAFFSVTPHLIVACHLATFTLASAVVTSFINLHHFIMDGAIWKLRKPDVGAPLVG